LSLLEIQISFLLQTMLVITIAIISSLIAYANGITVGNWTGLYGSNTNLRAKDISAKGDNVWITATDGTIYYWDCPRSEWQAITGGAGTVNIGATMDNCLWTVDGSGAVNLYNRNTQTWQSGFNPPNPIMQIGGQLCNRAIATSTASAGNNIFLFDNNTWTQQPTVGLWPAIGENDDRWLVGTNHGVYHWDASKNGWSQDVLYAWASNIDVENQTSVIHVGNPGDIGNMYVWNANSTTWTEISGNAVRGTIGRSKVYYINSAGQIWVANVTA